MKSGIILLSTALLLGPACRRDTAAQTSAPVRAAAATRLQPPPPEPAPPRGTQLTLLYSSNINGEYEPCG